MNTLEELKKQYIEETKRYIGKLEQYSCLLYDKEKLPFVPLELIVELDKVEREMIDSQYEKYEIHRKIGKLNNRN